MDGWRFLLCVFGVMMGKGVHDMEIPPWVDSARRDG